MSSDSVSELPVHYGEVQKDGTRLERTSEEMPGRQSLQQDRPPILRRLPQTATLHHASSGASDHFIPIQGSEDRTHNNKSFNQGRVSPQHLSGGFDGGKAILDRHDLRQSVRERRRYDDEHHSGYDDDEYYEPYRPRRIRDRPYFPEDEYEIRHRPSRISRQGNGYYRNRRRSSDDYDEMPRTPHRYHPQKKYRASRGPFIEKERAEEEGDEEQRIYQRDTSPAVKQLNFKDLTREERKEIMRLPWTQWMNSSTKNHFVATLGEFIGTTMFLWFAFAGTQVANIPSGDSAGNSTSGGATGFSAIVLLYIAIVFGFSLMVNVWVFFRISGGLFNPAVTLAMWMVSAIPPARALCLVAAQVAGSIAASALVLVQFPTALNVRTTLAGGTTLVQGVFIEAVLTAELVFTILMLAKEKHKATFIAPVGIGLALFVAELVGVFYTGGSLNPARSLGPCVVTRTFDTEHWIYWVGPGAGALAAVLFYKFIKMLEYEVANPGQDAEDVTEAVMTRQEKRNTLTIGAAL